jgi:anti-anti-sigma factor
MAEVERQPPTRLVATPLPAHDPLTVQVHRLLGGALLVEVSGAIDLFTAPDLDRQLFEATHIGQLTPARMMLDLSGVTFLDHAGLDALLHLQDRWGAASGTLELLAPSSSVVRLLHEADLDGASWMSEIHQAPDAP